MNFDESSIGGGNGAPQVKPLLRTLLLCDIVESTALVERLGDMRSALLLQKHDQLLRQAIAFCHGQLIDKADGVLALFERPIQALDFALRYQRGLHELGQTEGVGMRARIGMHVGDVMMWANEPRDVLTGSKPFEVEGLAKPVAARLMNLALPGQILLSGMAQNLCQRAVGELGEAGSRLRFVLHGRYRFKGVPAPMLVHEVGEPGLSPLRAPDSGPKAWRELPLWRRPPVLALEVLLVGVLLVGGLWTTLRSPPAIAFAERDWVVVADLQNRTDEPLFDDALDTALRIGLEQSRHINLISELQIDRALERMQRPDQPVDRQLATELALREGARVVILPTIAEVGGIVRVSLEVIDPRTGATVYSESADAASSERVLAALDRTTSRVRERLGEAVGSVEASSKPLQQVTTGNLQALRAYSLALEARYSGDFGQAEALTKEALRLDPDFAMAHLHLAFLRYLHEDVDGTRRHVAAASAHRERLSEREGIFLDGAGATLDDPELALEKFAILATMYPDEYRAHYNFAWFAHHDMLDSARGIEMLRPALTAKNARLASAHYLAGILRLGLDDVDGALKEFQRADALGNRGFKREFAEAHAARRDYAEAIRISGTQTETGLDATSLSAGLPMIALPLDQGRYAEALAAAHRLERDAEAADTTDLVKWNQRGITMLLRSYAPDAAFAGDLRAYAASVSSGIDAADVLRQRQLLAFALTAGWMAARTGDLDTARSLLDRAQGRELVGNYPALAGLVRIVEAEIALSAGEEASAIAILAPVAAADDGIYFERAVLMRAYAAAGDFAAAAELGDWLASHRGRAYVEPGPRGLWQAANLIEANLALRAVARFRLELGDAAAADASAAAFATAWPGGEELAWVRSR